MIELNNEFACIYQDTLFGMSNIHFPVIKLPDQSLQNSGFLLHCNVHMTYTSITNYLVEFNSAIDLHLYSEFSDFNPVDMLSSTTIGMMYNELQLQYDPHKDCHAMIHHIGECRLDHRQDYSTCLSEAFKTLPEYQRLVSHQQQELLNDYSTVFYQDLIQFYDKVGTSFCSGVYTGNCILSQSVIIPSQAHSKPIITRYHFTSIHRLLPFKQSQLNMCHSILLQYLADKLNCWIAPLQVCNTCECLKKQIHRDKWKQRIQASIDLLSNILATAPLKQSVIRYLEQEYKTQIVSYIRRYYPLKKQHNLHIRWSYDDHIYCYKTRWYQKSYKHRTWVIQIHQQPNIFIHFRYTYY